MKATAFINDYKKSKKRLDQECMVILRNLFGDYVYSGHYDCFLKVLQDCPDVLNTNTFSNVRLELYKLCKIDYTKHRIKYSFTEAMGVVHNSCCPEYFNLFIYKSLVGRNGFKSDFLKQFEHCSFYHELPKDMTSAEEFIKPFIANFFDKHVQLLITRPIHKYSRFFSLRELSDWDKMVDYKDPQIVELYKQAIEKYGDIFVEKLVLYIFEYYRPRYYTHCIELLTLTGNKLVFQKCIDILLKNKRYCSIELVYKTFNKPLDFNDFKHLSDEMVYRIVFHNFTFTDIDKQKLDHYNKERGLAFVVYYSFILEQAPYFGSRAIEHFVSEIDWNYQIPDFSRLANENGLGFPKLHRITNLGKLMYRMTDEHKYAWVNKYLQIFKEFYCKNILKI